MRSLQEFREVQLWGCADGRDILVKDIENGHLVNILNHILAKPKNYGNNLYDLFCQEAQYRKLISFSSNTGIPMQADDGSWWLADPKTGKPYRTKPPKGYDAAVKKKQDQWNEDMKDLRELLDAAAKARNDRNGTDA